MATKEKLAETFHNLMVASTNIDFPTEEKISKEVYSNLVLANMTNFRKLHHAIIDAQKIFTNASNPEIYSILENAYLVGKELNKNASWSAAKSKTELKKTFEDIVETMNTIATILNTEYALYDEEFDVKYGLTA